MTNTEKLEAIRLACIKANPSILDLTFGCEVITDHRGHSVLVWRWTTDPHGYHAIYRELANGSEFAAYDRELKEILGRKIGLADVIKAMLESYKIVGAQFTKACSLLCCYWECTKDDLRLQSEETVRFIYDILN